MASMTHTQQSNAAICQCGKTIVELTGAPSKIDKFVELMRPLGLLELSRTGVLSISRGAM